MIVSVGFLSAFEQNGAPSVTKRFFTSHAWHHWLRHRLARVAAHDRAADLVDDRPPRRDRLARRRSAPGRAPRPPIASMISRERLLHVRGLARLVLRPLPVEAQHRDAPLVLHLGIELAVGVLVRDHLAAAGELDERAVVAARVFLELAAVAAARRAARCRRRCRSAGIVAARRRSRCGSRARSRACRRAAPCRATTACRRACRRRRPRCAAAVLEQRESGRCTLAADRVHDVRADHAAGVGEPVREARRLRVEQDAHRSRSALAASTTHARGLALPLVPRGLVDEVTPRGLAVLVRPSPRAPWRR